MQISMQMRKSPIFDKPVLKASAGLDKYVNVHGEQKPPFSINHTKGHVFQHNILSVELDWKASGQNINQECIESILIAMESRGNELQ